MGLIDSFLTKLGRLTCDHKLKIRRFRKQRMSDGIITREHSEECFDCGKPFEISTKIPLPYIYED